MRSAAGGRRPVFDDYVDIRRSIDPEDAGISSEPALLSAGELTGSGDREVECLLEAALACDVHQELSVSQRLLGRSARGLLGEPSDLVQEPLGHLLLVSRCDSHIEVGSIPSQGDLHELGLIVGVEPGPKR